MPSEPIVDKIQRYREFLDSATRSNNDQQVLSVLEKLDKLPVSLDHLQETGIGKTVNGYRKYDDPVGKKAKAIVNKWKGLVQAAIAEEESSQRSCNSPMTAVKESEKLPHESVSGSPSSVSLESNRKKKGGDSRVHSVRKYNEKIGKRQSDCEGDSPPVKKHRESYPQNSGLKSAKAESQCKEIEHHDATSKDALRKKAVESKSSNDAQTKEAKSSSHSSKSKTQQQDSLGHVKSSTSYSSSKTLGHEVKSSTLSSHKDSLPKKSTAGDKAKEMPESSVKRKRLNENSSENSPKRQQFDLFSKLDEEELSDLETSCLQNRDLSSSLTQLCEYGDGASFDDCKSERESSLSNSLKVKSSSHKVSSKSTSHHNQPSSKSKISSDRDSSDKHSSLRDDNRAFENTSEGSSSSKHLSEKKSHTSSQSRKTDSSLKTSAKDISKDLSSKLSSVKSVSHKDVCTIGEDELSGSDFLKESLKKFEEPLEKHYIDKTDRKLPLKSSSKDSPVSKSVDRELENFLQKDRHEVSLSDGKSGHRSEKKLHDKNQSSRKNRIADSKSDQKDSDNFDSGDENNFQLFFEDLPTADSKSGRRKDDVRESGASKSSESRNKSSKDFPNDHRSSSSSGSVSRGSHDSHERIGGSLDSVAKKKKPETEAKAGQKNQEKHKSDEKSMLQQKDSSKSSESRGRKSEKSNSHSSKILDKKSETKESSAGHVTFSSDAVDSDLDDENSGMSFAACLNYEASTPQKKSATKSSKSSNVGIKDKHDKKMSHCKAEQLGGSILDQSLVHFPLPAEIELDLEHEDLPLYPSLRQEFQSKMNAGEKTSNTERRYGQKMIYSGRKQVTVPVAIHSLFDACIQVLQENVDDITYAGAIPADILMPVLKVCSVVQLERLEFYNPHFVGDTEELWRIHCNRDFRGNVCEDMESWRELHMRLQDAQNKRLAKISKNVMANKIRADKEVSKVQLTYVDNNPGRGHSSKNNFFGSSGFGSSGAEETCQPRSKQEILDSLKSQISKPPQRRRGGWGAVKPEQKSVAKTAAPLMQKTLQFFKKLRR